jgi:undecaprenyl-diphosphatase
VTLRSGLFRPLTALGLLGAAFVVYTQVVATGVLDATDRGLARAMTSVWWPQLQPVAQAIAVLGGIEATAVAALVMAIALWRCGYGIEAVAVGALPLIGVLEVVYKRALVHPPPTAFAHPDGPSLVTMLQGGTLTLGGSYPSGHMIRSVLFYGLGAFVVRRLASPGWARSMAAPAAAVLVGMMALDRVYLGVHWQSDVVGGLLLGGALLAGVIAWLDRPRAVA